MKGIVRGKDLLALALWRDIDAVGMADNVYDHPKVLATPSTIVHAFTGRAFVPIARVEVA